MESLSLRETMVAHTKCFLGVHNCMGEEVLLANRHSLHTKIVFWILIWVSISYDKELVIVFSHGECLWNLAFSQEDLSLRLCHMSVQMSNNEKFLFNCITSNLIILLTVLQIVSISFIKYVTRPEPSKLCRAAAYNSASCLSWWVSSLVLHHWELLHTCSLAMGPVFMGLSEVVNINRNMIAACSVWKWGKKYESSSIKKWYHVFKNLKKKGGGGSIDSTLSVCPSAPAHIVGMDHGHSVTSLIFITPISYDKKRCSLSVFMKFSYFTKIFVILF